MLICRNAAHLNKSQFCRFASRKTNPAKIADKKTKECIASIFAKQDVKSASLSINRKTSSKCKELKWYDFSVETRKNIVKIYSNSMYPTLAIATVFGFAEKYNLYFSTMMLFAIATVAVNKIYASIPNCLSEKEMEVIKSKKSNSTLKKEESANATSKSTSSEMQIFEKKSNFSIGAPIPRNILTAIRDKIEPFFKGFFKLKMQPCITLISEIGNLTLKDSLDQFVPASTFKVFFKRLYIKKNKLRLDYVCPTPSNINELSEKIGVKDNEIKKNVSIGFVEKFRSLKQRKFNINYFAKMFVSIKNRIPNPQKLLEMEYRAGGMTVENQKLHHLYLVREERIRKEQARCISEKEDYLFYSNGEAIRPPFNSKQLEWAVNGHPEYGKVPLCFSCQPQDGLKLWKNLKEDLTNLFKRYEIRDVRVDILGSSSQGFSCNWLKEFKLWNMSSDVDLVIYSPALREIALTKGCIENPVAKFYGKYQIYKNWVSEDDKMEGKQGFFETDIGKELLELMIKWQATLFGSKPDEKRMNIKLSISLSTFPMALTCISEKDLQ